METIRCQLARKIIGKKIDKQPVTAVRRRAKILIVDLKDGSSLVFHLKLTGQLIFNGKPSRHTREVFYFTDGTRLVFNDARKLGWWKKVKNTRQIESQFGPEALEIDLPTFKACLQSHPRAKIKPLLMDQKFIAGIGNIYSDEILFAAKVAPLRLVKTLTGKEIQGIFQNINKILKAAIKRHGSSVEYYLDAFGQKGSYVKEHKVYRREGEPCVRCGAKIKRVRLGGRSAHYCPRCQKL